MSKYNRYLFVKKLYPDFVVFLLDKGKLITYPMDLEIVELYGMEKFFDLFINYIIIDCLTIKEKRIYDENHYFYYFKICLLKKVVEYIKDK